MSDWQSNPIHVDEIEVRVHASTNGVTFGKVVDGIYSSDLLLTPDQARTLAVALIDGADHAEGVA
jgi:hypothetical protein